MTDERDPAAVAAELLPDDHDRLRGNLRDVAQAARTGFAVKPELAEAILARAMALLELNADGTPKHKLGPRSIRQLAAVAESFAKLNHTLTKGHDPRGAIRVPIAPDQLARMSDEELDAMESNLDRLFADK